MSGTAIYPSAQAHIEAMSIPEPNSGCWLWLGSLTFNGYGKAKDSRFPRELRANRISYLAFSGAIPAGQMVCHSCDVRSCVNPEHLWLGDAADNAHDRDAKGRTVMPVEGGGRERRAHCGKGHPFTRMWRGHQVCAECQRVAAREYQRRRSAASVRMEV